MPFDNPHQTPFGDIEILTDARNRIASQNTWLSGVSDTETATVSWMRCRWRPGARASISLTG
jgi:hypothetical protein